MNDLLKEKLKIIPKKCGCYLWKNKDGEVIYVGKANNLFNRTHQYFERPNNNKKYALMNEIFDLDYIVVNNTNEALILENNLIKKYWPKYNVMLKDSSYYSYIFVTNDKEPKIIYTHKLNNQKGKYYGPLADSKINGYELYKFLLEISPFNKNGPLKNQISLFLRIFLEKYKEFKIENIDLNLLANEWRKCIDNIFHGKNKELEIFIKQLEVQAVERLDFEHAKKYKELLESLEKINDSQIVQLIKNKCSDYFCYWIENNYIVFNVFNYLNGNLISKYNSIHRIFDEPKDVVINAVIQYYNNNNLPNVVIISLENEELFELSEFFKIKFLAPIKKIDKQIMLMGIQNAQTYLKNNLLAEQQEYCRTIGACEELAKLLNISKTNYIEAFDNSNFGKEYAVSGMVVFKNGLPSKNEYRKFNLSNLHHGDNFYMEEVIYRRYKSLIEKKQKFPDLIIVDGGIIQINAAKNSLSKLGIWNNVNLIGLKKDQNHSTNKIVFKNGKEIELNKKSNIYMFLKNIQDEVHRYAITFYKLKHSKTMIKSFLDEIKGLGEKSKAKLLCSYPNIETIKKLKKEDLQQILPEKKVDLILKKIRNL